MNYREYAYTSRWADGTTHTDTVYVPHPAPTPGVPRNDDRIVFDVQDYPSEHLALMLDRKWASAWLRTRRIVGRPEATILTTGVFYRRTTEFVPNMPVDAYAGVPGKVVLHGEDMGSRYGYSSGETVDGARYTEQRLDSGGYYDFHFHAECDEHDEITPDCGQCDLVVGCNMCRCDCISKLEQCTICNRDLGDGDAVWLCLNGGEYICPEHIVHDERPDSLFKRVSGVRGAELPAFAWPGGYLIRYMTRDLDTVCAGCASKVEVSDPAAEADIDEEMDCVGCGHAQSFHRSEKSGRTDGNSDDVGQCGWDETREDPFGNEVYVSCGCDDYFPLLCDDCCEPLDPALRAWWAQKTGKVTA